MPFARSIHRSRDVGLGHSTLAALPSSGSVDGDLIFVLLVREKGIKGFIIEDSGGVRVTGSGGSELEARAVFLASELESLNPTIGALHLPITLRVRW